MSGARAFGSKATSDQTEALPDADFVIVAVERERMKRWRMDWEIPLRHGLRQPVAETAGPGGFAHAARNIPTILGICEDMRRLCPEAWLLNFSNPVSRLTLAATKYGGVKTIGYCNGIGVAYHNLSRLLGVARREMDVKAAGLNHFTWVLDIRKRNGEDLYPALRSRLSDWPADFLPLTRDIFDLFGLFPAIGDNHIAEYLPWVCDSLTKPWEKYNLRPIDWQDRDIKHQERVERTNQMATGAAPLDGLREGSGERAAATISGIVNNSNSYELALDIPNDGYISNLPEGCIVELPATVSGSGARGLAVGDLPGPIAELCRRQAVVADLAVEAAVKGDRRKALLALLLDPIVTDMVRAQAILDDLLAAHLDLLPQFR